MDGEQENVRRFHVVAFFTSQVERSNNPQCGSAGGSADRITSTMLQIHDEGSGQPALVLIPFLGGSQREWIELEAILSIRQQCIAVDLPGFGASNSISGYSVSEMCDALIESLASLRLDRYVLVGHSMAGKISAVVARRLSTSGSALQAPEALVLVAPSPPGPEPMDDSKRSEMLGSLGTALQRQQGAYSEQDRPAAASYISSNLANRISDQAFRRTVDDVLVMNPEAWVAWLTSGSKEDWSSFVGVLDLPTLIVAGAKDKALGPEAQRTHTLPHFSNASLRSLDCSHLVPLEKPEELASLITRFQNGSSNQDFLEDYKNLITSPRVSPQTREVLLSRLAADDPEYQPQALTATALATLRHVLARVIPQETDAAVDFAARLDQQLAKAKGDGWRYATLPSDAEAFRIGLSLLDEFAVKLSAVPFARLASPAQDSLLEAITVGRLHSPRLDLKRWFEDLRASAVELYVAHPATLARMGYSGIADNQNGFVQIGIGEREAWEPESK